MKLACRYSVKISAAVLALFQFGCGAVAPLQTEEQEQHRLELRKQFASSTYPGKAQEEIFAVIEQVLGELDENGDFSFKLSANVLLASRDWRWFGGLIGKYSRHYFKFTADQSEDGLVLTISGLYRHKHGDFGWSKPQWDMFLTNVPYSGAWSDVFIVYFTADDYRLLHNQIKYKLGLLDHWYGCKEARAERLETELYWTPYLCYDQHGWRNY